MRSTGRAAMMGAVFTRTLLVFCLVLALAFAGEATAAPPGGKATGRAAAADAGVPAGSQVPNLEVPGALDVVDIPGTNVVQGIPVRLVAVRSKWKLEPLLRHYLDVFARANLYVDPKQRQMSQDPQLTALDPVRLVSYTIILQPNSTGTTVIVGEAKLGERQAPGDDFAPLMPGATEVVRADNEGSRTLGFAVRASEAEVVDFYRQTLGKAGFREVEPGAFRRGGMDLRVFSNPRKGGGRSVMLMLRAGQGEPALPGELDPPGR